MKPFGKHWLLDLTVQSNRPSANTTQKIGQLFGWKWGQLTAQHTARLHNLLYTAEQCMHWNKSI